MKIIQVISDSNIGGAGILVLHIAHALKDEFDMEIVLPEGASLASRAPHGVKITPFPLGRDTSFRFADVKRLRAYFKAQAPDIVHTHAAFSARLGAGLAGVKTLLSTRHCASPTPSKRRSLADRILYNLFTTLTVSTSRYTTESLIDEGISPARIVTIENGSPDTPVLSDTEKQRLRGMLGLSRNDFLLGSCARLENVKGQDIMLRALRILLQKYPNLRLLLVGDGSQREAYASLARELGVSDAVRFLGYTETPFHYQNLFDLNLNASRGTETTCLATSECMSLGVPTVASNVCGNPDMIADGVCGLLFESEDHKALANQIERVILSPILRQTLATGAKKAFEERFCLSKMTENYRRLYRSLVKK